MAPEIAHVLADLNSKLGSDDFKSTHAREVILKIKQCLLEPSPIPRDVQEQYVKLLANVASQDRYGK